MTTTLSSEFSSSNPTTLNYEEALPFRVNREGVKNYIKNRGSLNIGNWAIEGRKIPTIDQESNLPQPKVLGPDALRNYTKSRCTTPNLLYGNIQTSDSHHGMRVKREGRANYEKNQNSQMKSLLENYGKSPLSTPPVPHTQGEIATNLFYSHQEGHMGTILNNYDRSSTTPRPHRNVKGIDAEMNREKGHGDAQLFNYNIDRRLPTPEPHVKGLQAQLNYDMGQGHHINELFSQYGKLQESSQTVPKVKYDGVQNLLKGQGDAMRKTLSQCPLTNRPQSVPI